MDSDDMDENEFALRRKRRQRLNELAPGIAKDMIKTWTNIIRSIPIEDLVLHARFPQKFVQSIADFDFWNLCQEQRIHEYLIRRRSDGVVLYHNVELVSTDFYPGNHA
jgi:hypothetical protein